MNPLVRLPMTLSGNTHTWHVFAIRCEVRDKLKEHLAKNGIQTNIHYPFPIHLQNAYNELSYKRGDFPIAEKIANTELSLPMYYGMTDQQIEHIVKTINDFRG